MSQDRTSLEDLTFKAAYEYALQNGLDTYKQNSLAIYALHLYLSLDDIDGFAASAITEDTNDKKADIFYIDLNEKRAIITQNYFSETWGKPNAPEQKASDLNTAITWLLTASEDVIPIDLKPKAIDLRKALKDGDIESVEIFYIHNCYESRNVGISMKTVADHARVAINAVVGTEESHISVIAMEIGIQRIEEFYKGRENNILIEEWLDIPVSNYVAEESEGWTAILTSVPGSWIKELYDSHKHRLFSANYRDYLGSAQRKGNINRQITETAEGTPHNFWVYNNGITALTNELRLDATVHIRGISIINGAQTTGALSAASMSSAENVRVLLRVVECTDKKMIDNIIQYNNTQNDIKPADRRSNDPIQKSLKTQFEKYGINYMHRRSDARISRNDITATSVAAALCAFHGNLQTAHRNAPEIFVNNALYDTVFPLTLTAEHVFLLRALSIAIDKLKIELKEKVLHESATKLELLQNDVLRYAASKPFIIYLLGESAEEIAGKRISNKFEWKCNTNVISPDNHSMSDAWIVALRAILPQIPVIVEPEGATAFYDIPRSADQSKKVANKLKALLASLEAVLGPQFDDVRQRTTV